MLVGLKPVLPAPAPQDIDSYTVSLLHFGGQPGTQIFADDASPARWWTGNGYAQITAQQVWSGFSCLDLRRQSGAASWIDTPAHADFNVGSGDFTVECTFIITGGSGTYRHIFGQGDSAQTVSLGSLRIFVDASTDKLYATINVGSTQYNAGVTLAAVSYNVWHHVAFVRYGDNYMLFLDGVAQSGNTVSGAINSSTYKFAIGRYGELPGYEFVGVIDEFRFSKGIARWTANFTPPNYTEYGYQGIDGYTKLLMHFDGPFDSVVKDGGFLDHSQPSKGHPFLGGNCRLRNDYPNFGYGQCYFDGSGDYFWFPGSDDFNFGAGDFTIDFWMRANSLQQGCIFAYGGDANNAYRILTFSDGNMIFNVTSGGVTTFQLNADIGAAYAAGTWVHLAFVRWGNVWRWFVNGRDAKSLGGSHYVGAYTIPTVSGPALVGTNSAATEYFNGYLDELRVSKGIARWTNNFVPPKSAYAWGMPVGVFDGYTKLLMHFEGPNNGGQFIDYSAYAHEFTVNGGGPVLSTAQSKYGAASCSISTGQYLTSGNHSDWELGSGDFTIEWWDRFSGGTPNGATLLARDGAVTFSPWLIGYVNAGNLYIYMTSNGSAWDIANLQLLGTIAASAWHHRAITRQGSTFRTFYDGAQQATWSSSAAVLASSAALSIGRGQSSATVNGVNIDELRISKGVSRYNANFTPSHGPHFN